MAHAHGRHVHMADMHMAGAHTVAGTHNSTSCRTHIPAQCTAHNHECPLRVRQHALMLFTYSGKREIRRGQ
eukprot:3035362-Alexandrium_andersonii.AAC.1